MTDYEMLTEIIMKTSPLAFTEWQKLQGGLRRFFDAWSAEWAVTPLARKIRVLRIFQDAQVMTRTSVLDLTIEYFLQQYLPSTSYVLNGFGEAMTQYAAQGFTIRILPPLNLFRPHVPLGFYIAALCRMLEDGHLGDYDHKWNVLELKRLESAIASYLRAKANNREDK